MTPGLCSDPQAPSMSSAIADCHTLTRQVAERESKSDTQLKDEGRMFQLALSMHMSRMSHSGLSFVLNIYLITKNRCTFVNGSKLN